MSAKPKAPPIRTDGLLLNGHQAAQFLNLSRSTFDRMVASGKVPKSVKVPGIGRRWKRTDLERFVEKL